MALLFVYKIAVVLACFVSVAHARRAQNSALHLKRTSTKSAATQASSSFVEVSQQSSPGNLVKNLKRIAVILLELNPAFAFVPGPANAVLGAGGVADSIDPDVMPHGDSRLFINSLSFPNDPRALDIWDQVGVAPRRAGVSERHSRRAVFRALGAGLISGSFPRLRPVAAALEAAALPDGKIATALEAAAPQQFVIDGRTFFLEPILTEKDPVDLVVKVQSTWDASKWYNLRPQENLRLELIRKGVLSLAKFSRYERDAEGEGEKQGKRDVISGTTLLKVVDRVAQALNVTWVLLRDSSDFGACDPKAFLLPNHAKLAELAELDMLHSWWVYVANHDGLSWYAKNGYLPDVGYDARVARTRLGKFQAADSNGDGVIDAQEFAEMKKSVNLTCRQSNACVARTWKPPNAKAAASDEGDKTLVSYAVAKEAQKQEQKLLQRYLDSTVQALNQMFSEEDFRYQNVERSVLKNVEPPEFAFSGDTLRTVIFKSPPDSPDASEGRLSVEDQVFLKNLLKVAQRKAYSRSRIKFLAPRDCVMSLEHQRFACLDV